MAARGPYDSDSSSDTPATLGARIKMLRIRRRLTQAELGQGLNTDQTMVSLWERGKARPSGAALAGVAAFFGVAVAALETGEGLGPEAAPEATAPQASGRAGRAPVALPDAGPGGVLAMDLRTRTEKRVETLEAMGFLMKVLKEGRSVWIVAE